MVKSSEVLRLAAELALDPEEKFALTIAGQKFELRRYEQDRINEFIWDVGYCHAAYGEESCMALCLAAAIAEDEGD